MTSISFGAPQTDVGERDGSVMIPLLRTGDLTGTVVAGYQTSDDTAAAGIAYAVTAGSVTFEPGETSKLVSIPILDEGSSQGSESFGVELQSVTGGDIGFPRTTRVVIHDGQALTDAAAPDMPGSAVAAETAVVSGLSSPTAFDWVPGQPDTMVIAEKSGLIRVAQDGAVLDTPLLDLRSMVNDTRDRGLIDVKLDPHFATQPYLYAYLTVDPPETADNPAGSNAGPDGQGNRYEQLMRFTVDTVEGQFQVRPGSGMVLLGGAGQSLQDFSGSGAVNSEDDLAQPPSGIRPDGSNIDDYLAVDSLSHAGGDMEFGPDGALYVSVSDGAYFSSADPRTARVQDVDNLSGKVLRIDPLTGQGLPDNPFYVAGAPDSNQSKVYQLGVRNAFRMAFDATGRLFLGDVGWYSSEEIDTGGPGANFGWPYYEGGANGVNLPTPSFQDLPQAQAFYASGTPVTAPLQAFSHLASDPDLPVQAIVLGDVHTGPAYGGLQSGDVVFSSLTTGQIFSMNPDDPTRTVNLLATTPATIVFMKEGSDGAFYYADLTEGTIGRLQVGAAQDAGGGGAAATTVGAGPDALVLQMQQDAYGEDAQYAVSVDGVQFGDVLTATATRASGQFDTLTVLGDFGPGLHQATVSFLNDAWDGTPDTDRNLFLASASYNGAPVASATQALFQAGPASFSFNDVAPAAL